MAGAKEVAGLLAGATGGVDVATGCCATGVAHPANSKATTIRLGAFTCVLLCLLVVSPIIAHAKSLRMPTREKAPDAPSVGAFDWFGN
jgi:hypothetical protein